MGKEEMIGETVYVLFREAIYQQGICGVYVSEEDAENAAVRYMKQEPDNHHQYVISKFDLNHDTGVLDVSKYYSHLDNEGRRLSRRNIHLYGTDND